MYRCHYARGERGVYPLTPLAVDTEVSSQECLCSSRAQADKNLWLHYPVLGLEPGTASLNFRITRLFVNPPFSALRGGPLEMFHHIGNVRSFMLDTSLRQRFIQESSGWSDKRVAAAVRLISRLLTHEHDSGPGWTLAKDRLGCLLPKITSLAGGRSVSRRPAIVRGGDTRAAGRVLPV